MKPETQRRVTNLIRLLKKGAYVKTNGEWEIMAFTTKTRNLEPCQTGFRGFLGIVTMFESIPHFMFGRVKMV